MQGRSLTQVKWEDIRSTVFQVNSELATILDKISPDKHFKLYKGIYDYGDLIVQDGTLHVPEQDNLVPITKVTDSALKDELTYSTIPLSLLLNKSSEVFIYENERVVPLNMLEPGEFFGIFEVTDTLFEQSSKSLWNVSAGGRSILALPKISEAAGLNRLRIYYGMPPLRIQSMADHWQLFSMINRHGDFKTPWKSEVLFFSKEWITDYIHDPAWGEFKTYLFKKLWRQAQYAIKHIEFASIWQSSASTIAKRNLKPSTYSIDTLKHILLIGSGAAPAFRPTDNSQYVAPTANLEKALAEVYGLKKYIPNLLYMSKLDSNKNNMVYYSLSYPTLIEGSPFNKQPLSLMLTIRNIKLLIDTLQKNAHNTKNHFLKKFKFNYFHVEKDLYGEIQLSKNIAATDARFLEDTRFKSRKFCNTSCFWRGCIKLSLNTD